MSSSTDPIPTNTNHRPALARPPTHLLTLTSFSHRLGPLVPAPTPGLAYDIRALPNAPRRLRAVCVGTDKPLREAFMDDARCRERVEGIVGDVWAVLSRVAASTATGDGEEQGQDKEEEEAEPKYEPPIHVRVGVCCEMGRHRSVACVEALARVAWPSPWEVEVVHRDLKKVRSERDKEKRVRASRRGDEESDEGV